MALFFGGRQEAFRHAAHSAARAGDFPEFPALRAYWKEVSPVDFFYAQMPVLQPDDKDNDDHLDLLWED